MSRFLHAHRRLKSREYVGPVEVRETENGRGMVATRDICVGELLLEEQPLIVFEKSDVPMEVQGAIAALKDTTTWKAVSGLHPRSLEDVSPEALGSARRRFGARLFERESGFDERLRLVLCMQFNAFDSGCFKLLSMFNHSCAPNAVRIDGQVFATRRVERGADVTLSYDYPVESATVRRRRRLRAKYDFDCTCLACRAFLPEKANDEANVEDKLRDVTDLDSAHDALVDAIATLGDDAPLTLRARRALVAQTKNDDVALVERALDLRHHEINMLGDHPDVASTDLIAADALQRALTTSWNLPAEDWEVCLDGTFPRVGGSLAVRLEHLEFCLRTSAERIARKYRRADDNTRRILAPLLVNSFKG